MYTFIRRGAVSLAAAVLGLALGQAPAFAAGTYPVYTGTLSANSSTSGLAPGSSITISGGGFAPGAEIVITAHSAVTLLGTATADATGTFTATVTLNLAPGTHTIVATGAAATGGTLEEEITVVIAGSTGAELAHTGADVGDVALGTAAAAAAGSALILLARRRRQSR